MTWKDKDAQSAHCRRIAASGGRASGKKQAAIPGRMAALGRKRAEGTDMVALGARGWGALVEKHGLQGAHAALAEYHRNNPSTYERQVEEMLAALGIEYIREDSLHLELYRCCYRVDFFVPSYGLVLEVHGEMHEQGHEWSPERERRLAENWPLIVVWYHELKKDPDAVRARLVQWFEDYAQADRSVPCLSVW